MSSRTVWSMQLSSPTVLAVTSLTWPRSGPTLFLSLKTLGTHTNTACLSVRGLGLAWERARCETGHPRCPGGGPRSPDSDGLEWMNRLSLQKCKWSGEPGEVEVAVLLQGPRYLGPWANLFPSNLLTFPPPTEYFLPACLQNPVPFMLPLT